MPIIDGVKMACDACIRGHRSTKCNHAESRIMIPVRKPGRPLTSCPHLPSQKCECAKNNDCGCTSTTVVAFRKNANCGSCKTGPTKAVKTESTSDGLALQDLPAAMGNCRVRKPSQAVPHLTKARPQSFDADAFNNPDFIKNINIISNGSMPGVAAPGQNGNNGLLYQTMTLPMPVQTVQQQAPDFGSNMVPPAFDPFMANGSGASFPTDTTGAAFSVANLNMMNRTAPYLQDEGSGLSASAQGPIMTPYPMPQSQLFSPNFNSNGNQQSNSSFMESPTMTSGTNLDISMQFNNPATFDGNAMQFNNQLNVNGNSNGMQFSNFNSPINENMRLNNMQNPYINNQTYNMIVQHQNNIYAQPSMYGTARQPLQLQDWQKMMQDGRAQPGQPLGPGLLPNNDAYNPLSDFMDPSAMNKICSCGPSCQCLMCMVHPYNKTMLNHVQKINQHECGQGSPGTFLDQHTPPNGLSPAPPPKKSCCGTKKEPEVLDTFSVPTPERSPGHVHTPNNEPSPMTDGDHAEQHLDADGFVFFLYPVGGDCGGEKNTCLCGDGCQCPGCTLHQVPAITEEIPDQLNSVGDAQSGESISAEPAAKRACCGGK